jgi:hypothetical protein
MTKTLLALCGVVIFVAMGCNGDEKSAMSLQGKYTESSFSLLFKDGKCYCIDKSGKDRTETKYLIKKDKLYIAPIVPKGQQMTRNVWVVYTIKSKSLESSHLEDMNTGDVFYKEKTPKIVLVKE